MIKKLLALVAVMGLSATTGCMAPVESEEIDGEATEEVGEAKEALTVNLACTIIYSTPPVFETTARITNNSAYNVPADAEIQFTIVHGSGPNFNSSTDGPLARFASMDVPLTHADALDAISCTAKAIWYL